MEGYWVPGLSHGTEKAKTHPPSMMSEQLYLGQERAAVGFARWKGEEGQREQTPPRSAMAPEPHPAPWGQGSIGDPPPPAGPGLALMEGARWAPALAWAVGDELPARGDSQGRSGSPGAGGGTEPARPCPAAPGRLCRGWGRGTGWGHNGGHNGGHKGGHGGGTQGVPGDTGVGLRGDTAVP